MDCNCDGPSRSQRVSLATDSHSHVRTIASKAEDRGGEQPRLFRLIRTGSPGSAESTHRRRTGASGERDRRPGWRSGMGDEATRPGGHQRLPATDRSIRALAAATGYPMTKYPVGRYFSLRRTSSPKAPDAEPDRTFRRCRVAVVGSTDRRRRPDRRPAAGGCQCIGHPTRPYRQSHATHWDQDLRGRADARTLREISRRRPTDDGAAQRPGRRRNVC